MRIDERDDRALDGREKFWSLLPPVPEIFLLSMTPHVSNEYRIGSARRTIGLRLRVIQSNAFYRLHRASLIISGVLLTEQTRVATYL